MLNTRKQRGDTIIEVLFAFTVFSLVAITGLSLMNQGTALSQRALEISLVRQQIDSQADALRYLNHAYVADYGKNGAATTQWNRIVTANAVEQANDFSEMAVGGTCNLPSAADRPFALDIFKFETSPPIMQITEASTYAKIRYGAAMDARPEGLWVQAVRSPQESGAGTSSRPGFYDFHIRACWSSPGQSVPVTIGTIVRLYEPRG